MSLLIDNRILFSSSFWQQGHLLLTTQTKRWESSTRNKADYEERCCAFINFSSTDEGRGREFVFKYNCPEECLAAINLHNSLREKYNGS